MKITSENAKPVLKAINRHLRRHPAFQGGREYGVDHITWSLCYPQMAGAVDQIGEILTGRPGRYVPRALC